MKPRYVHDCRKCMFYGHMDGWGSARYERFDVYACDSPAYGDGAKSVVLRHGDEQSQYISMPTRMMDRGLPEPYESARKFIFTSEGKQP